MYLLLQFDFLVRYMLKDLLMFHLLSLPWKAAYCNNEQLCNQSGQTWKEVIQGSVMAG